MTSTETIVLFAAEQVAGKLLGAPIKVFLQLHRVHFTLLSRALSEAKRDQKIQKTIEKMLKGVKSMLEQGKQVLGAVPAKPKPPSADLAQVLDGGYEAAEFADLHRKYMKGVANIIRLLEEHEGRVTQVLDKTQAMFKQLEKIILKKTKAKVGGMRALSQHYRSLDLFKLSQKLTSLNGHRTDVRNLIKLYKNH